MVKLKKKKQIIKMAKAKKVKEVRPEFAGGQGDMTTNQVVQDTPPVQDPESIVYHPLLVLDKDNFVFTPSEMDRNFYEGLYALAMKINTIAQVVKDPELGPLNENLNTFLMANAYKCQQEGLIESVKMKDWETKVATILEKFKGVPTDGVVGE